MPHPLDLLIHTLGTSVRRSTDARAMRRLAEVDRTADVIDPTTRILERHLADLDRCIDELNAAIARSASDSGIAAISLASAERALLVLADKIKQRRTALNENSPTHQA
jgi:hypothetical protein